MNDSIVENISNFTKKPYEVPLFQKRYITMHVEPEDLRQYRNKNYINAVGLKFQLKSTDTRVLNVEKVVTPAELNSTKDVQNIQLEDLFICK